MVRVDEKYGEMVQEMHLNCEAVVRCALRKTEAFKVNVGLHVKESALSRFLFAVVGPNECDREGSRKRCTLDNDVCGWRCYHE